MKKVASWRKNTLFLLIFLAGATACAPRPYRVPSRQVVYREKGLASWYGRDFHGRKTSSGERYNMYALTAAHRTLPLGTIARVTHANNGKKIIVKINDRGPFIEGRIIDLSYGAARKLGMVREGVAPVILEAFGGTPGVPAIAPPASYSIQVGSFFIRDNAVKLREIISREYPEVSITDFRNNQGTYYRVRLGHFTTEEEALKTARSLEQKGYSYFIVREN